MFRIWRGILNNLIEGKRSSGREELDPETAAITCEQCGMTYGDIQKRACIGGLCDLLSTPSASR